MPGRVYAFIDAENHFRRGVACAAALVGSPRAAEALSEVVKNNGNPDFFPYDGQWRLLYSARHMVFWDCRLLSPLNGEIATEIGGGRVERAIHVAPLSGAEEEIYDARVRIRELGFEPVLAKEKKDARANREARLAAGNIITKAKGCDIALATRMVADAAANLYDICALFTSDEDYTPAVEAVQRMGKRVFVFGYRSGTGKWSALRHVPDRYIDLDAIMWNTWANAYGLTVSKLHELGEPGPFRKL